MQINVFVIITFVLYCCHYYDKPDRDNLTYYYSVIVEHDGFIALYTKASVKKKTIGNRGAMDG